MVMRRSATGRHDQTDDSTSITRRSILKGTTATATGLALGTGFASGDPQPLEDGDFVEYEWGYKRSDLTFDTSQSWPTIVEMEGYAGASRPSPNLYLRMSDGELMALRLRYDVGPDGNYAYVNASIRGTECSGGHFNLYDRRHAWDGHEIIEWIADQPWSNSKVGMRGSSYPGQTAFFVATTQPPHLEAISANLLHSDIYRDILYPGGVQNYLFPTTWTYVTGPHRAPTTAGDNGTIPEDRICTQNQASRYQAGDTPQPQNEPIWAAADQTYNDWFAAHAAMTYAEKIDVPYYQQVNWQDEQVGPRGIVLFNSMDLEPREIPVANPQGKPTSRTKTVTPKKLVTSSGDHGWGEFDNRDLWDWMDIWLRGQPDTAGLLDDTVETYFETRSNGPGAEYTTKKTGNQWPFADTDWQHVHLREEGQLSFDSPEGDEAPDRYLSGVPRKNWFWEAPQDGSEVRTAQGLPDGLGYESPPLEQDLVIAGPMMMDLYASIQGVGADFFVSIVDVYPDGKLSYLQRGLLKASHRQVDPHRSRYTDDGLLYLPVYPHTNPQPAPPNEIVHYQMALFPLGHIFREGHRIRVQIHTPPVVDGLWGYTPTHHKPAPVVVHHDVDHPSRVQLPVVEPDGDTEPAPEECGVPGGFPCSEPSPVPTLPEMSSQAVPDALPTDNE
jgi:putative CocE/NonD family hydrolase